MADRTSKSYSLPNDLLEELEVQAGARLVAPSMIVEKALRAFLPTLPSLDGLEEASSSVKAQASSEAQR